MEWGRNVGPEQSCGRWRPAEGEAKDVTRVRLSPMRVAPGSVVTIGSKLYLPRRAVAAMGAPERVAVEIDPAARVLVVRPDDGPDTWHMSRAGIGTPALLQQLREHGWGPGHYPYRVVGREIHVQNGGNQRGG